MGSIAHGPFCLPVNFMATKTKKPEMLDLGFIATHPEKGTIKHLNINEYVSGIYVAIYLPGENIPIQACLRSVRNSNSKTESCRAMLKQEGGWTIEERGIVERKTE